jgi:hypothetical protein
MSFDSAPDVSIVVVSWNAKRYVLECLESLYAHPSSRTTEIIVVDNDSSDGTPEAIRAKFPRVTLIQNEANMGFAKGNNIGMAAAKGRYLCLVNSDVVVPADCIDTILNYLHRNPRVGLLGPKMLAPDGSIGQSVKNLPTVWNTFCVALGLHSLFPHSRLVGGFEPRSFSYSTSADVEVVSGWFWVARLEAIAEVGGLDERFFMYGEDIDWCRRFRQAGWRVVYCADAEALHYGAASSARTPARFYTEMYRANLQYFRKHHAKASALAYRAVIWLHQAVRVTSYALLFFLRPGRRSDSAFKVKRSWSCLAWITGLSSIPTSK